MGSNVWRLFQNDKRLITKTSYNSSISVINSLRPPQCNSGVFMRMSQSTTKMFPSLDLITFSS